MINLNIQLSIILFSTIYGFLFYYLLIICKDYLNIDNYFFRIINTISFFLFFILIYYIGIEIVCDGIFHFYSILIIIFVGTGEYIFKKYYK